MGFKSTINKWKACLDDNAPEILTYVGVAGIGVGTVMACIKTPPAVEIIENHKSRVKDLHEFVESDEYAEDRKNYEYTDMCFKRDMTVEYFRFLVDMAVNYAIPFTIIFTSGGMIIKGQKMRKKRYLGALAWAESLDRTFKKYRQRARDKYGEEEDMYFMYGIRKEMVEVEEEDEKGKKKKVKKEVVVSDIDPRDLPPYTFIFDETCLGFDPNLSIFRKQIDKYNRWFTDKLRTTGRLFENDLLREIEHPAKDEGQDVGWIYNPDAPYGNDYVEMRILNLNLLPETGNDAYLVSLNIAGNIRHVWQEAASKCDHRWHA